MYLKTSYLFSNVTKEKIPEIKVILRKSHLIKWLVVANDFWEKSIRYLERINIFLNPNYKKIVIVRLLPLLMLNTVLTSKVSN
jgi:hypothetical protein